jgi:hypothetical protein
MTVTKTPTLHELVKMKEDFGLEGEPDTFLTTLLAKKGGGFLVMKGPSRSGKDYIVAATNYCELDSNTASIPESSSPTALFEKKDKLNSASVHIYPDMGSEFPEHLLMQIKRHGEGRSITHEYTDVSGGTRQTVEQTIHPPDGFVMFIATDNEDMDLNDYPEVRNRALIIYTDASKEQNDRVLDRQAREESTFIEPTVGMDRANEIRRYLDEIPTHRYNVAEHMEGGIGQMKVPFSWEFRQQEPLPSHFPEVRMDYKRLMKFMKIMSIFHHQDRMDPMVNGAPTLLVTPIDGWLTMRVFGEKMIMSSLNLEELDLEIVQELRDANETFTVSEIQSEMRSRGYHVTDRDVRNALKNMKTKGYVDVDQSATPHEWHATAFATVAKPHKTFDWEKICNDAKERLYDDSRWPHDVVENYSSRFLEGPQEAVMPFGDRAGEVINIKDWEGFSTQVEEAMEEVDAINDEGVYGGSSNDEEAEDTEDEETVEKGDTGLQAYADGGGDFS